VGRGEENGSEFGVWPDAAVEALFEGSLVFGRSAAASDAPLPDHLALAPSPLNRVWFESTAEIFFDDRVAVIHAWSDALAQPLEPVAVTIRRFDSGTWVAERVTMLNLLDHPVGAVLIGIRRLGVVPTPVRKAVDTVRDLPEVASVRRPTWVLQELDSLGHVLSSEGDVEETFGVSPEDLEGRLVLDVLHPGDHATSIDMWTDLLAHPRSLRHVTQRVIRPDGSVCWIEANVINHLAEDGSGSVLSIVHDVTERRGRERDLLSQARADALTGLPNRSAVISELEHRLEHGRVTAAFVDLDGFKKVNDAHGHLVGDRVLDVVARRLVSVVPDPSFVGRWGGDEFVVLCSSRRPEELEAAVRAAFIDPITVREVAWPAGVSIGVVVGNPGEDPEDLLRRADETMYLQKASKRS